MNDLHNHSERCCNRTVEFGNGSRSCRWRMRVTVWGRSPSGVWGQIPRWSSSGFAPPSSQLNAFSCVSVNFACNFIHGRAGYAEKYVAVLHLQPLVMMQPLHRPPGSALVEMLILQVHSWNSLTSTLCDSSLLPNTFRWKLKSYPFGIQTISNTARHHCFL